MKVTVFGNGVGDLAFESSGDRQPVTFTLRGSDGFAHSVDLEASEIPRLAKLLLALVAPE